MRRLAYPFLILSFLLCAWAYYPGLGGIFVFDDVANISDNEQLKIEHFTFDDIRQASLSSDSGPLRRPLSMLSFAVNHVFTGMDPWWMKLTNLFIHLLNGIILLLVLKELFSRLNEISQNYTKTLPYIITGIWLVHPINLTSVSYIVQRMTSLSATFILLAMYCYLKLRNRHYVGWRGALTIFCIMGFWALGLLSKENAILLSIYIFILEWCLFGFKTHPEQGNTWLLRLTWIALAIPWAIATAYIAYNPSYILSTYAIRDFTLYERILTEFRILIEYIRLIVVPDISQIGLYHDDFVVSTSLFKPITTFFSLILIIGLLGISLKVKRTYPLISMGMLWFFGGHILESTVIALELVFLHRNYLPSIGILLVLSEFGNRLYTKYGMSTAAVPILIVIVLSISTRFVSYQWSDDAKMLIVEAINNPDSARANFRAGQAYKYFAIISDNADEKEKNKNKAIEHFTTIRELDEKNIIGEMSILETHLRLNEYPPEDRLRRLIQKLPTSKVDWGLVNVFGDIKECMVKEDCLLREEDYFKLVDAFFKNELISNYFLNRVLMIHSGYMAEFKGNLDAAIDIAEGAYQLAPNLESLQHLIMYYEEAGYLEKLQNRLDDMERSDKFGRYNKFIRETRNRISTVN